MAKFEAFVNILVINLTQIKKLNRVILNHNGNENGKKSIGLISQKTTTLHMQHTFFVHFLDAVLYDYIMKLPSYTSYVGNVVCAHQRFCCLCSCSLFFFPATHLHLAGR